MLRSTSRSRWRSIQPWTLMKSCPTKTWTQSEQRPATGLRIWPRVDRRTSCLTSTCMLQETRSSLTSVRASTRWARNQWGLRVGSLLISRLRALITLKKCINRHWTKSEKLKESRARKEATWIFVRSRWVWDCLPKRYKSTTEANNTTWYPSRFTAQWSKSSTQKPAGQNNKQFRIPTRRLSCLSCLKPRKDLTSHPCFKILITLAASLSSTSRGSSLGRTWWPLRTNGRGLKKARRSGRRWMLVTRTCSSRLEAILCSTWCTRLWITGSNCLSRMRPWRSRPMTTNHWSLAWATKANLRTKSTSTTKLKSSMNILIRRRDRLLSKTFRLISWIITW